MQDSERLQSNVTHTHTHKEPTRVDICANSKSLKLQSAMEYLMTYGWAILIIAIVLVALFSLNLFNPYTFAPRASPGSCQIMRPNGPGSNLFVSAVGPACTINEIPQYVAQLSPSSSAPITIPRLSIPPGNINAITYTAWIKTSSPSWQAVVDLGRSAGVEINRYGDQLFMHECMTPGDVGMIVNSNINLHDGMWHFVALSYSQSANSIIGEIDGYNAIIAPTVQPPIVGTSGTIGWDMCDNAEGFVGQISNVQIYNTSLSASELTALYNEGIGGAPTNLQNLIGWWPLNGNSKDYSGNNNNGVPTNVIYTSSWTSGYTTP